MDKSYPDIFPGTLAKGGTSPFPPISITPPFAFLVMRVSTGQKNQTAYHNPPPKLNLGLHRLGSNNTAASYSSIPYLKISAFRVESCGTHKYHGQHPTASSRPFLLVLSPRLWEAKAPLWRLVFFEVGLGY